MENFLKNVLTDLNKKYTHFDDIIFILPSKRAGLFLKQELSTFLSQPIFSPRILSIEEFVEDLSGLRKLSNIELLFRFYSIYNTLTPKSEIDNFEQFSKWAQILIQDFNEIDRYLIPQDKIFEYLNAIKELQHWSLGQNQTDLIKAHLKFWNRLKDYYAAFRDDLLQSQQGYQGLIYREAVEHVESYVNSSTGTIHVFLGFNALNNAESRIIQELLANDLADIYWDIDKTFFDDTIHDAGLFMRQYQKEWYFYKNNPFKWISENYSTAKHIQLLEYLNS